MDRVQADITLLERLTIGNEARCDVIHSMHPGSVERLWLQGVCRMRDGGRCRSCSLQGNV